MVLLYLLPDPGPLLAWQPGPNQHISTNFQPKKFTGTIQENRIQLIKKSQK